MEKILGAIQYLPANYQSQSCPISHIMARLAVLVSWQVLNGSQDFFHPFSMALYHKWDVKNALAYVLQFFSLITDSLGSVFADYQLTLLTSFFFKTCIWKLLFNHTNEFQTMLTSFPEKKNNMIGINEALFSNISSVVEFQRRWVLKSKLFGQESTYHQGNIPLLGFEYYHESSAWVQR